MGFLDNLRTTVEGKLNRVSESMINDEESLDLAYQKGLDQHAEVRQAIVKIAGAKKLLEQKKFELSQKIAKLTTQAQAFIDANDDEKAATALRQKATYSQQVNSLIDQIKGIKEKEKALKDTEIKMAGDLESMLAEKEALKARLAAAKSQSEVDDIMTGLRNNGTDIGAAVTRTENKIAKLNARNEAVDELINDGTLRDGLGAASTDRAQAEMDAAAELAAMKAKRGN